MGLAQEVGKTLGRAIAPLRAGTGRLASNRLGLERMHNQTLAVVSSSFYEGEAIPLEHTADGDGLPPPIAWSNVPGSARSMVLLCEDADAPTVNPLVQWLVYGVPSTVSSLDEARELSRELAEDSELSDESERVLGREGKNSSMRAGYSPPAPPAGHGVHRYHFQVFALDTFLELEAGVGRTTVLEAMRDHVLAWGETIGTYQRT